MTTCHLRLRGEDCSTMNAALTWRGEDCSTMNAALAWRGEDCSTMNAALAWRGRTPGNTRTTLVLCYWHKHATGLDHIQGHKHQE